MTRIMTVHPHTGVGELRFGMSRADVQRILRIAPKRFKSSVYSLEEDLFETLGMNVSYDEQGVCNAISVARGHATELEYNGYRLFAHPARVVREWARSWDPQLDPKDGFTSKLLGLGMWADWIDEAELDADELQDPAASFIIFRHGYYEEERARLASAGLIAP